MEEKIKAHRVVQLVFPLTQLGNWEGNPHSLPLEPTILNHQTLSFLPCSTNTFSVDTCFLHCFSYNFLCMQWLPPLQSPSFSLNPFPLQCLEICVKSFVEKKFNLLLIMLNTIIFIILYIFI